MSTATYPLGMSSWSNRPLTGGYKSWKPTSVPVGITAGSIRPYSNKDYTNDYYQPPKRSFPGAPRNPRPIKHFRKGRQIVNPDDPVVNRVAASSTGGSLVKQMMDNPGSYSINTQPPTNSIPTTEKGICIVSDYFNKPFLTENPIPTSETKVFCCSAERKALKRVRPASTNLSKNYFTTLEQYRVNRCQTFEQRSFNFVGPANVTTMTEQNENCNGCSLPQDSNKPGGPQMLSNAYIANCQPAINFETNPSTNSSLYPSVSNTTDDSNVNVVTNPPGCTVVIYKPNNYKYAKQGAVSSSARLLNLNYATIQTNKLNIQNTPGIKLKNKAPGCFPTNYNQFQHKTRCAVRPELPIKFGNIHRGHSGRNVSFFGGGIISL